MNHGISGLDGRINPYRQLDQLSEPAQHKKSQASQGTEPKDTASAPSLGPDLSKAESRMINQYFPPSEQITLRLYGPSSKPETLNPNAVGQRLDLRG
jgi:hypothetical protein